MIGAKPKPSKGAHRWMLYAGLLLLAVPAAAGVYSFARGPQVASSTHPGAEQPARVEVEAPEPPAAGADRETVLGTFQAMRQATEEHADDCDALGRAWAEAIATGRGAIERLQRGPARSSLMGTQERTAIDGTKIAVAKAMNACGDNPRFKSALKEFSAIGRR